MMVEKLQGWTALLVALTGLATILIGAVKSEDKKEADYGVVKILAEQLADAREDCK